MKILKVFTDTITFLAIVTALCLCVPPMFGYRDYVVLSGSMEPVIPTGSLLYTDTHAQTYQTGDIITFQAGEDTVVTHRIESISEEGEFTTKGDANENADLKKISEEDIIGRYLFSIPYAGRILEQLHGKTGLALILWIFALNAAVLILDACFAKETKS